MKNYLKITSSLNKKFRPQKTLKKIIVKLHITLSLPALLYSNENRTITTSAEIKYMFKKGRIKLDSLQIKYRDCTGINYRVFTKEWYGFKS